jgi:hypothetical protein
VLEQNHKNSCQWSVVGCQWVGGDSTDHWPLTTGHCFLQTKLKLSPK